MTTPSDHDDGSGRPSSGDDAGEKVDLGKSPDEPFDPYRFGRPEHPVPPEYAPPGYVPDPVPYPVTPPPPGASTPGGGSPYGAPPYAPNDGRGAHGQNPYGQPPYGQNPQDQSPYGQNPYGQNPYGQPPYGQSPQGQGPYGQSPYGQSPHGQSPYGQAPQPPYGPRSGGNGKATTAMVLGIIAVVLSWTSFFDLALIIPAIVFGLLGLTQARARGGLGRGQAVTGLICAGVAAVLAITMTVFVFRAYDRCGGISQSDDPGFNECVQDNFLSGRDLR